MHAKRSMIQTFLLSTVVLSMVPAIVLGYLWVASQYQRFEEQSQRWRDSYLESHRRNLESEVARIIDYLDYERARLDRRAREDLREEVEEVVAQIDAHYRKHASTRTREQLLEDVADLLRPVRFNDGRGWYVLLDQDGTVLMNDQRPELKGRNIVDSSTMPQEMALALKNVREKGSVFSINLVDQRKAEPENLVPRLLYGKFYEPLRIVVSAGEYLSDVERQVREEAAAYLASGASQRNTAALFVYDEGGDFILGADAELLGYDDASAVQVDQRSLLEHQREIARWGGGFAEYRLPREHSAITTGLSYVRGYPAWGWTVGAGFVMDSFESEQAAARAELDRKIGMHLAYSVAFCAALMLLVVGLARWMSKRAATGFSLFTEFFRDASRHSGRIEETQLPYSEFAALAGEANLMIAERGRYENAVRVSEKKLDLALRFSSLHLVEIDARGKVFFSDSFFAALGFDGRRALDGVLHENDVQQFLTADESALDSLAGGIEFRALDADGQERWWFLRAGQVDEAESRVSSKGLGTVLEITERKALEKQLRLARRAAEEADHAKSQFLASVSHELRTPLNGILGYAQLMQRDPSLSEENRHNLAVVENCGFSLLTLINDVLDITKIDRGNLELNLGECDLADVLYEVSDLAEGRAESKHLEYRLRLAPGLPERIVTDRKKLQQILHNLLTNAIKFTDRGDMELVVTAPPGEGMLRFDVRDTGVGIKAEDLQRIFEPFAQDNTMETQGTGLGLTLSKRLAEALGGHLSVSSEPGVGSCFTLFMPLQAAQLVPALLASGSAVEDAPTVLVVDHNNSNRVLLISLVETLGFHTLAAESGVQALELVRRHRPRVVLCKVDVPEMDGFSLARHIDEDASLAQVSVLLIKGDDEAAAVEAVLAVDDRDILQAPLNLVVLREKLLQYLGDVRHLRAQLTEGRSGTPPPPTAPSLSHYEINALFAALDSGDIESLHQQLHTLQRSFAGRGEHKDTAEGGDQARWFVQTCQMLSSFDLDGLRQQLEQLRGREEVA